MTEEELNEIAEGLTEEAQLIFVLATQAIMSEFPSGLPFSVDHVRKGLEAAIKVVDMTEASFSKKGMN